MRFYDCAGLANVTISSGVTNISSYAFGYCFNLSSITLPGSVTSIGEYAFAWCFALRNVFFFGNAPTADSTVFTGEAASVTVYYPAGTTGWGDTFGGVRTLVWDAVDQLGYTISNNTVTIRSYLGPGGAVTVPGRIEGLPVTGIGDGLFAYNATINTVVLPDSVTTIGFAAFAACTWLFGVIMPTNALNIGDGAFWQCRQLAGITIPDGVTNIGSSAFYYCASLRSISLPNSLVSIGGSAFEYCWRMTNVTMGASLANIGDWAFAYCGLTNLTIPDGMASIGATAPTHRWLHQPSQHG